MNTKLDRVVKVGTKIMEIGHWIAAVGMVVALVLTVVMGRGAIVPGSEKAEEVVSTYGFEMMVSDAAGEPNMGALRVFCVGAALILALMAMVFRNVHLIVKNSWDATPFQKDNVRMVREIGIFLIAVPVVGLVMSIIGRLVVGPELAEISVNWSGVMVGLVMLCLSRIFAHGLALETDVDGLV